ncbi:S8 family serine peptidase [Arenicella sp.]|nr:S8 family serine peptidase [Arenicella sp.]
MYFRSLIVAALILLPSYGYASRLTLDRVNSLYSDSTAPIRVMVQFNAPSSLSSLKDQSSISTIGDRDAYLSRLIKRQSRAATLEGRYIRANLRTLSVSRAELIELLADDSLQIYQDKLHKPSLASSVEVIFPTQSVSPFSGAGETVAVLDTGVAKNHTFLAGSVIDAAEACFSTSDPNNANQPIESLCPNQQESMIGSGAAAPCDASIDLCAHGTQMAGVIAGQGSSFNGVATSANIIAVQVYSISNDEIFCGNAANTPCIGALTSNIIEGLDYINSIKNSYSIAAVNISLGSTATYQGQCNNQDEPADYLSVIADLTASGIAVIASSGNFSMANEMSSPACLEDVIAVAATNDNDVPNSQNNRSSELDFFAPGVSVRTSSLPVNSFSTGSGTSISAAHVSGAWAVLKSQNPNATVPSLKNRLSSTGTLVTQGLVSKPRINLTAALGEMVINENDSSFLPAVYLLLLQD